MNTITSSPPGFHSERPDISDNRTSSEPSLYEKTSDTSLAAGIQIHEYAVHYGRWRSNLIFSLPYPSSSSTLSPVYLANMSSFRSNLPDVTIHCLSSASSREDTNTPIVGVAHFHLSRDVKMGLGDPNTDPAGVVWEEMSNERKLKHDRYRFEVLSKFHGTFENEIISPAAQRKGYIWQRTRASEDGVSAWGKWSLGNYKLIDESSGEMIAVFLSNGAKSWKKAGKLRVKDGMESEMEIWIVLSAASIAEKLRRRTQHSSCGGAGGC